MSKQRSMSIRQSFAQGMAGLPIQAPPMSDEEMWNSWSSDNAAAILLDGMKMNDIFTSIKKQIELLKKRQTSVEYELENGNVRSNANNGVGGDPKLREELTELIERVVVLESNNKELIDENQNLHSITQEMQEKMDEYAEQTEMRMKEEMDMTENRLKEIQSKLDKSIENAQLERTQREAAEKQRLKEVEALHDKRYADLLAKIEALQHQVSSTHEKGMSEAESVKEQMDKNLSALLQQDENLNKLRDLVEVNNIRITTLEGKFGVVVEQQAELKDQIDSFPNMYLDAINNNIVELFMDKANKTDLETKADVTLAMMKADLAEVSRLEEIIAEQDRKINHLHKEIQEGVSGVDAKLDKKTERIAQYCLKHLRRELKHLQPATGDARDGTDIGRMPLKCLVCDQPVTQQVTPDHLIFGGPAMKNVMGAHTSHNNMGGTHHQQQQQHGGGSPPRQHQQQQHTLTQEQLKISSPIGKDQQAAARTHSKLVRMGAITPNTVGASTPNVKYAQQVEDPDYIADFKYRLATENGALSGSGAEAGFSSAVRPQTAGSSAAPSPQVSQLNTEGKPTALELLTAPLVQNHQQMGYFRDLEA